MFAPPNADYLRYFDSFTNVADQDRIVDVAWGGATGAYEDGGLVAVATSSSGDRRIDASDTFVTVMQNAKRVDDPMKGPSGHGPSSHVLGSRRGVLTGVGDMYGDPFTDPWPGFDPAHIGYVFRFTLKPRQTTALMTFVVKGLSEVYGSRGATHDSASAGVGDRAVLTVRSPRRIARLARAGSARPHGAAAVADRQLARRRRQRGLPPFSVVEKTSDEIQDALTRGMTTSEDVVREYLQRLTAVRSQRPGASRDAGAQSAGDRRSARRSTRNGPPAACAVRSTAFRSRSRTTSTCSVCRRPAARWRSSTIVPRLDSRMAAGMRRAGAVMLGKANLDEFPFGDFGISTVGGTIGNAYDPSLSTAGSSGGSAIAVATSLVTLGFGTDTCNSLSNPAAFASLATIRTTRGLTSRAGVMPLNTYNDAVGPMAKSVRDARAGARSGRRRRRGGCGHRGRRPPHHAARSPRGSNADALSGARIGVLRQRFVGITGEREIATMMDTVAREIEQPARPSST